MPRARHTQLYVNGAAGRLSSHQCIKARGQHAFYYYVRPFKYKLRPLARRRNMYIQMTICAPRGAAQHTTNERAPSTKLPNEALSQPL